MAITSESQIIDAVTISRGCSIIEECVNDYKNCEKKLNEAADICTNKVLSVENKSMQPTIRELASSLKIIQSGIYTFTAEIRNAASKIQEKQMLELREYTAAQAKQEALAAEAAAAGNSTANTTTTTSSEGYN